MVDIRNPKIQTQIIGVLISNFNLCESGMELAVDAALNIEPRHEEEGTWTCSNEMYELKVQSTVRV